MRQGLMIELFSPERCWNEEVSVSCTELLKMTNVWLWLSKAPIHQTPEPNRRGRAWWRCRWSPHLRIFKQTLFLLQTTTQWLWRCILSPSLTQRFDNREVFFDLHEIWYIFSWRETSVWEESVFLFCFIHPIPGVVTTDQPSLIISVRSAFPTISDWSFSGRGQGL